MAPDWHPITAWPPIAADRQRRRILVCPGEDGWIDREGDCRICMTAALFHVTAHQDLEGDPGQDQTEAGARAVAEGSPRALRNLRQPVCFSRRRRDSRRRATTIRIYALASTLAPTGYCRGGSTHQGPGNQKFMRSSALMSIRRWGAMEPWRGYTGCLGWATY